MCHYVQYILTVWVVAVHVPSLTFVQPVPIVNDAHSTKAAVGARFDDGVPDAPFVEPSSCTHMKAWDKKSKILNKSNENKFDNYVCITIT